VKARIRLGVVAVCMASLWLACAETDIQAFIAGQYMPKLDCVTPGYAIDVISAPPVDASCDAVCVIPPYDSGVYVSGQCAPFPPGDLINPDASLCVLALAAINRHDLCLDGGPSNPRMDAGIDASEPDAGASHDAHTD
jgi:hypothetical protein